MPLPQTARAWLFSLASICVAALPTHAANVKIGLPLQRDAYQTNEWIDISVVRSDNAALPAGTLTLHLQPVNFEGGDVVATFDAPAVAVQGKEARRVEHLHISGWLLRPGKYHVTATIGANTGAADIEVVSHVRQSSFRLVNWGRAEKDEQLLQGEDSFGFNLFYGNETKDSLLRAGVDAMGVCVMSGGHQMDLRFECDWSDPYVTRGGTRRVVQRALHDRTRPNVPGVHFYDEPGLTWGKHPTTGEFTPHDIPAQLRSYKAAYDKAPPHYNELDPKNADQVARWQHWITWKLSLMDAAWKESQFGVQRVRPDFLSLTQSQYGWTAFSDGYYFTVAQPADHERPRRLSRFRPRLLQSIAVPGDGAGAGPVEAVLVPAVLVRQHDQRSVPPGTVPRVPDRHPGHDVAARPGAGEERLRPRGHRRIEPAHETARPDLHDHAADENAGRHALLAVGRHPRAGQELR